jgi:hypothetical protein
MKHVNAASNCITRFQYCAVFVTVFITKDRPTLELTTVGVPHFQGGYEKVKLI